MSERLLSIPRLIWLRLVLDLRRRGHGRRESGAFLLGRAKGTVDDVNAYVCYDDVDPIALDTGIVIVRAVGFAALWERCRQLGMDVLADVHTHGDARPRQSPTDRANPMISRRGHVAMVLPVFATTWSWRLQCVAVSEYLGGYQWRDWRDEERAHRVRLRWI